jgi:hypothetical protein
MGLEPIPKGSRVPLEWRDYVVVSYAYANQQNKRLKAIVDEMTLRSKIAKPNAATPSLKLLSQHCPP